MTEPRTTEARFVALHEKLLRAGVAPRHAQRACLELADHHGHSVAAGVARGESLTSASAAATRALGDDATLVQSYVARRELLSWPARRPLLVCVLLPALIYLGCSAVLMACLIVVLDHAVDAFHWGRIAPATTRCIDTAVQLFFLGVMPLATCTTLAALAHRRRLPLQWPVAGIALVCLSAACLNVSFVLLGAGPDHGQAGAGIGVSSSTWMSQAARALGPMMLVVAPLAWTARRSRRLERSME